MANFDRIHNKIHYSEDEDDKFKYIRINSIKDSSLSDLLELLKKICKNETRFISIKTKHYKRLISAILFGNLKDEFVIYNYSQDGLIVLYRYEFRRQKDTLPIGMNHIAVRAQMNRDHAILRFDAPIVMFDDNIDIHDGNKKLFTINSHMKYWKKTFSNIHFTDTVKINNVNLEDWLYVRVRRIQRQWRKCISDPNYLICQNRLKREFDGLS